MSAPALVVEGLVVEVAPGQRAVDGVGFVLEAGSTLGLVGESGCGKTLLLLAIAGLLPPGVRTTAGRIAVGDGAGGMREIHRGDRGDWSGVRGRTIGMVFQDPEASLDPVFTVGAQLAEVLRYHRGASRREARGLAAELLRRVGLGDVERLLRAAPHELSGGMQQRVAIALALAGRPRVIVADEPTTALDVTIQRQVLDLLDGIRRAERTALLLVSHDLGVVADLADELAVLYAGRIVERGPTPAVLRRPMHPYTRALLAARPRLDGPAVPPRPIPGRVPGVADRPRGCAFHPRCPEAVAACRDAVPALVPVSGRDLACPVSARGDGDA